MAYNILGIHPGHNGSAALISDGELVYYLEEERLTRNKWEGNPFKSMLEIMSKYPIDELIVVGTETYYPPLPWDDIPTYEALVKKFNPKVITRYLGNHHHITHASCAFYNSGFDEAVAVIVDGAGAYKQIENDPPHPDPTYDNISRGFETETIIHCKYPTNFKTLYTVLGDNTGFVTSTPTLSSGTTTTLCKTFEAVNNFLGWRSLDSGKTMGLAPYGKFNPSFPPFFVNGRGNGSLFTPHYPGGAYLISSNYPIFQIKQKKDDFSENETGLGGRPLGLDWHFNFENISDIEKDVAWHVQNDTQILVGDLIQKAIDLTGLDKVIVAGGYGLNCVANYYLKKRFPNIKIYHEPISHDGGTSIGGAKLAWYEYTKDQIIRPQTSIYHGPQYDLKIYKKIINKYNKMFNQYKINPKQVAQLISERNIVTIFQGRSEAGPRALGNRSILYDPTDPNGKDFVNKVKKREWFRPFAGTVLLEKANEWFDMAGLEESPFMMYAMDVWPDKQEQIQAITHVDGTCRIQTVTEEQNPHYYRLIQEFEKITGVPILFNTSFNLAGDPLVETIEDALETMLKSEMKYMYVPELEMILEKK